VAALIHTMVDLQCDMDVSEHLPGMFVLAAHHDDRVREFVQTHMLAHLPKLTTHEDLSGIPNVWPLVDTWVGSPAKFASCAAGSLHLVISVAIKFCLSTSFLVTNINHPH